MGLISFGGLGSGLDVNGIVDALVQAERAPTQFGLDRQETNIQITLSGLGALKSAMSDLRSAAFNLDLSSNFNQRKVTLGSTEFFSATADTTAQIGNYDIEVTGLAAGTELSSNVFTGGPTTTFGAGTLTFTVGTDTFNVSIDAADTLEDIRNNINAATDNIGVNVNVLNNVTIGPDTGSIMTMASTITGTGNDLVVTYSGDVSLADLSDNLNTDTTAIDASIKIDGFSISSDSNVFSSVLNGVSITAKKQNVATETNSLTIANDTAIVKTKINEFIEAFNNYAEVSQTLGQAVEGDNGLLLGDYTLRQSSSVLRRALSQTIEGVSGSFNSLSAIGITTTRTGTLELDDSVLTNALTNNFEDFDELFTGDTGFGGLFVDIIDQYNGANGSITSRETSLNEQLKRIGEQRIDLDYRIELLETRLLKQFAVMDSAVAQFNSTGAFLTQQLANLPGFSSGKKD